jgi:hypothetical protein
MRRALSPLLLVLIALGAAPAYAQVRQPPSVFRGAPGHPMRPLHRNVGASFFAPVYWDEGDATAAPAPTNLIVLTVAPPPAPLPPLAPASVETTPRGVTIFRGPEILQSQR